MRTTTEILAEICARPELDGLRLEYADACAIKDPDYAEYVRHEIAWASRMLGFRGPRGSKTVEERIAHPFLQDCYDVQFYRGFIEEVTMDPYVFLERGARLLDRSPIRKITFTPKPAPPGTIFPLTRQRVPSLVPEIMACPYLTRVFSISFVKSNYHCWYSDVADFESVLSSRYLDRMISFGLAEERLPKPIDEAYLATLWERAFERPEFRKMLSIGFPGYPGEYAREYEDGWDDVQEPMAMSAQGKELERKHGYLPSLHVATWWGDDPQRAIPRNQKLVLGVLRGTLPKYPVGTPMTDAMYALPPTKRSTANHDW